MILSGHQVAMMPVGKRADHLQIAEVMAGFELVDESQPSQADGRERQRAKAEQDA